VVGNATAANDAPGVGRGRLCGHRCLNCDPLEDPVDTTRDTFDLPSTLSAPATARKHVGDRCGTWLDSSRDVAILLTSELVTNAVLHGEPPFTLTVLGQATGLRVEVADASPSPPRPRQHVVGDIGGRGLALVGDLASDWGAISVPDDGKVVWFTLPEMAGT
jgi:anti-sigma regulatory factor (Ser/Thr protein kinase)